MTPKATNSDEQMLGESVRWNAKLGRIAYHWPVWLAVLSGVWVTLPWLAPLLMRAGATVPAHLIYLLYSPQCHQLPQRSYFLFGDRLMIPLADILAVTGPRDPLTLRWFLGTPDLGWKVAWSDRMVSLYTPLFVGAVIYLLMGRRWRPPRWSWALLLPYLPLLLDGLSHAIDDTFRLGIRADNTWLEALTGNRFAPAFYAGDAIGSFNWIDDDPSVTRPLKRSLFYEGYTVVVAGSGEAGLKLARDYPPDLIVLDIVLPDANGLEVLRRLRAADPQLPILILTAKDAPSDQVLGLESGADDYVVKPFSFGVLMARIRALLRRHQIDHPGLLTFTELSLDTSSRQVRRGQREIVLTALEFKLLRSFLEHPQQVLSKAMLIDQVWGRDFTGSPNVVEVYVKQLRQKLEADGAPRLLHSLRDAGYVLREAPVGAQPSCTRA